MKTKSPTSTSKGLNRSKNGIPSHTTTKMKQSKKSTEEKTSSSTKEIVGTPAEETPSTRAHASEHDNLSVLVDTMNISQVGDDTPLVDFIKMPHMKSKIFDVDK